MTSHHAALAQRRYALLLLETAEWRCLTADLMPCRGV